MRACTCYQRFIFYQSQKLKGFYVQVSSSGVHQDLFLLEPASLTHMHQGMLQFKPSWFLFIKCWVLFIYLFIFCHKFVNGL